MGKYIKTFEYHDDYGQYAYEGMTTPNVSVCIDESHVHYMPKKHNTIAYDANGDELCRCMTVFNKSQYVYQNGYVGYQYENRWYYSDISFYGKCNPALINRIEAELYLGADSLNVTCGCQDITFNWDFNNNLLSITNIQGFENHSCNGVGFTLTYSLNGENYENYIVIESGIS